MNTRTIVKIPLYNPYEISYVHPITNKVSYYSNPSKSLTPLPMPESNGVEEEEDLTETDPLQIPKNKTSNIKTLPAYGSYARLN